MLAAYVTANMSLDHYKDTSIEFLHALAGKSPEEKPLNARERKLTFEAENQMSC